MIFGSRKLRLRGPDKSVVTDGPMIPDHAEAEQYGHQGLRKLPRIRLGKLALYYRDLGKDYYVPYDYIDRSFVRISECQPDDSPAYYYYRVIAASSVSANVSPTTVRPTTITASSSCTVKMSLPTSSSTRRTWPTAFSYA